MTPSPGPATRGSKNLPDRPARSPPRSHQHFQDGHVHQGYDGHRSHRTDNPCPSGAWLLLLLATVVRALDAHVTRVIEHRPQEPDAAPRGNAARLES